MNMEYRITILGDVPSKANSYKVATIRGHGTLIKTKTVKDYEKSFFLQCQHRNANITGFFKIEIKTFFSSNRKDLDGCFKTLLDCLQQCNVIKNDRQCVEIHAYKYVDKENPRVEITITEL
ncbi:MAG: RusA family crossover junction endodeoxyribonuclease [Treponema sp.]|nr:RusA family crossover junction endodeoxyribonuclease [Treponema sp.]